jgi:phosphate transport system protein
VKTEALTLLKEEVLSMGRGVETTVQELTRMLKKDPSASMTRMEDGEEQINRQCMEIEERCLELLVDKEPMNERIIRSLVSTILIATKLERMADHAIRVAKVADWAREEEIDVPDELIEMSQAVGRMVQETLLVFLTDAPDKAIEVVQRDNAVDYLHDVLSKRLLSNLGDQDTAQAQMRMQFLFCTRFLERMGDACASINKRVYFIATGNRLKAAATKVES